jgi:hypothetical protein
LLRSTDNGLVLNDGKELTVQTAWEQGHGIRHLMRTAPQWTISMLILELGKLVDFVDAKKTLKDSDQLLFTAESLVEDFPSMKLEEFVLVFNWIKKGKFGKMYERLKLAEIEEAIKTYEGEHRAQYLENRNNEQKHQGKEYDPTNILYKPTKLGDEVREALTFEQKQKNIQSIQNDEREDI